MTVAWCETTCAFDLASELARAKPGSTVELPAGTFAAGIKVPAGVTLRGAGYRSTFLEARGTAVAVSIRARGATLEDLCVLNNGTGIELSGAEDAVVRRVMIVGGSMGISARDISHATIENTIVSRALIGISLNGATRSTVVNCTIATADACGLSVSAASDTAVFNNLVAEAGTGVVIGSGNQKLAVDYNLYVALGIGKIEGQLQRPSLPTWRDVSGLDAHSVQLPVTFANPSHNDFHPVSTLSWDPSQVVTAGWAVAELAGHAAPAADMDGQPRPVATGVGAFQPPRLPARAPDGRFTIAGDEGRKSAGLFTADNRAVCYLFQGLPLKKGDYPFVLPSRDLFGRPIPPDDYELRIVESRADWVYRGMTTNAGSGNTPELSDSAHVSRVAYTPDGQLLTASGWSERHINLRLGDPATGKARWVFEGSSDTTGLCLDGEGRVLLVRSAQNKSFDLFTIDAATGVPLARPDGSRYVNLANKFQSTYLGGVAELGGKLFVADTDVDKVFIDGLARLEFATAVDVAKPVSPAADRIRNLVWLISNREKILVLGADGRVAHEFSGVKSPLALAVAGDRLAVASGDTGKIHVLDIHDPAKPVPVRTLGRGDGPFGPWLPDRFHFQSHPLNAGNQNVSLALHTDGSVALRDSTGRVVTFGPEGKLVHEGIAQWGNDPLWAPFAGDKAFRIFDTSARLSYFLDPVSGSWKPDTNWGLPPMPRPSVHGFFSAGGKNFGVFVYQNPVKGAGETILIANFDNPVVRAVAVYQRGPKGSYLLCKDTNHDGRIDDQDEPGRPVLDTDGKPVTQPLSGRFLFVRPDGTIYHSGQQLLFIWKFEGLDDQGVPIYEFGSQNQLKAQDPEVPSPYQSDKSEDLRCVSAGKIAPDGGVCAAINLRNTPHGMGLSNSGGTDLARWNPDGSLRWLRTMNDYSPIQGVEPFRGVTVSSWGHQAEFLALDDDGLELGRFGFPAQANWSGYWVDHPQQWAAVESADRQIQIIIGDYTQNCHHWMTLRGTDSVHKSSFPVKLSAPRGRELAYAMPRLHESQTQARPPEIIIKKLPGAFAIDGKLDKWRRLNLAPQVLLLPHNCYGKINGPKDCSGVIRLGYRDRDLYASAVVFDNVVSFHQPAARFYKGDSLQFCINGFLTGFGFNLAQTIDKGPYFLRNRFFFNKLDLELDPAKAPRVIQRFARAGDMPERQYIESIYGVDLSDSPGYVIEFKLPLDEETYQKDEKIIPPVGSGKWFWLGFMLNDNDTPGTDVQNFISWPSTFNVFNPPESGAKAFFE
jgi:hypothetical protein